jgi:uncharacterized protein (TIGR03435 family)
MTILGTAFGLERDQILGPSWLFAPDDPMTGIRYDIAAKVPAGATKEQANVMMQNLLKSRLGLTFHYEKRDFDMYALVLSKNGSKLKPAQEADTPPPPAEAGGIRTASDPVALEGDGFPILPPGRYGFSGRGQDGRTRMTARMMTSADIAKWVGFDPKYHHIVDKTGLTGKYDFKIEYSNGGLRVTAQSDVASDPVDDLEGALEKQLGLKLEKTKAPMDVLVIDRLDQFPTEN